MSLFDRLFVGKVIKDFGTISEKTFGIGKQKVSLLLVEKSGTVKLVIKTSSWGPFGGSVSYTGIPSEAVPRFQQLVNEAGELLASGIGR